jgi:hypothetical protein
MSLFQATITLDGSVDSIATLCNFPGAKKKGIRQLTIQGVAGNAAATVGTNAVVTAGGGLSIAAASIAIITLVGPFSGNASTNLDEWYIKGTNTNTFTVLLITP